MVRTARGTGVRLGSSLATQRETMASERPPSVQTLCRAENPFDRLDILLQRLRMERTESRHLEWKSCPPAGKGADQAARLRMAKAAFSFANTDGGFIVFGIDREGGWAGFSNSSISGGDPAQFAELFNSYVEPEIRFRYETCEVSGKWFGVLHVPPSPSVPHVTIKDGVARLPSGELKKIIAKHCVYVRYGGKSDLASPSHYRRMIAKCTRHLKDELLRRFKEIIVAVPTSPKDSPGAVAEATLGITRVTDDPAATAIRLTRDPTVASGMVLYEQLPGGFFDDVNNVVQVGKLIAGGEPKFAFRRPVYYRVYAERQDVDDEEDTNIMLAGSALHQLYAPCLFWLLRLKPAQIAALLRELMASERSPNIRAALRFSLLLGEDGRNWAYSRLAQRWKGFTQRPDYFHWFEKLHRQASSDDVKLLALGRGREARLTVAAEDATHTIGDLLDSPQRAAALLSDACRDISAGGSTETRTARDLDITAYGGELQRLAPRVTPRLIEDPPQ